MRLSHLFDISAFPRKRTSGLPGKGRDGEQRAKRQASTPASMTSLLARAGFPFRFRRLAGLAVLAIMLLGIAPPAQAQTGPSGTLTVQMRVSDMLVEETLDGTADGGTEQGLAAGGCSFSIVGALDFGVVKLLPGKKLPLLFRGADLNANCSGAVVGEGTTSVSLGQSSANGYQMTLNGVRGAPGIPYELYADASGDRTLANAGGFIEGTITPRGGTLYTISTTFYGKVIDPLPVGFNPVPGTYRDTLTVAITF